MKNLPLLLILFSTVACDMDFQIRDSYTTISVRGIVVDSLTMQPLAGAIVELEMHYSSDNWDTPGTTQIAATAHSDASGFFYLEHKDDEGSLTGFAIRMPFYQPVHPVIRSGHNNVGTIKMHRRGGAFSRFLLDNTAEDSGSLNEAATIQNGIFVEDRFSRPSSALRFSRLSQTTMTFPSHVPLWRSPWTFSIWFKLDSLPSRTDDAFLFHYGSIPTATQDVFLYVDNDDNQIKFYDGHKYSTFEMVDSLTWYHTAVTFDGEAIRLFVNGVKRAQVSWTLMLDSSTSNQYVIGSDVPGLKGGFDGAVDDIRFYDYRLASYEIQAIYDEERYLH